MWVCWPPDDNANADLRGVTISQWSDAIGNKLYTIIVLHTGRFPFRQWRHRLAAKFSVIERRSRHTDARCDFCGGVAASHALIGEYVGRCLSTVYTIWRWAKHMPKLHIELQVGILSNLYAATKPCCLILPATGCRRQKSNIRQFTELCGVFQPNFAHSSSQVSAVNKLQLEVVNRSVTEFVYVVWCLEMVGWYCIIAPRVCERVLCVLLKSNWLRLRLFSKVTID